MCLYNDDSGDDLIPELDLNSYSESDNEIPIPLQQGIQKKHNPIYCPSIPFSENQGPNNQLENDIRPMSHVFFTSICFNMCEKINLYARS